MARLLRAAGRARDGLTIYDDWTVKEIVAHVAAWDRELTCGLDQLLQGVRPSFPGYDEGAFNGRAVGAARDSALEDVIEEAVAAHTALVDKLEGLSDEDWGRDSAFFWGDGLPMTVGSLFGYTYKGQTHYAGHADEIEQAYARR